LGFKSQASGTQESDKIRFEISILNKNLILIPLREAGCINSRAQSPSATDPEGALSKARIGKANTRSTAEAGSDAQRTWAAPYTSQKARLPRT
jgi:hypothetical protein